MSVLAVVVTLFGLLVATEGLQAKGPGGGGGPNRGTIVGEVVDGSGGVGGATVLLFDGVSIDQVAETVTDADGNFSFGRVREGSYTVTAVSLNPPCTGSTSVTVVARKIVVVVVACS